VDEALPDVWADPGLLERVVANVVGNALSHGRGAPVAVRASAHADQVPPRVVDNGPGIPPTPPTPSSRRSSGSATGTAPPAWASG
jgi:signal transduction histidine kinase